MRIVATMAAGERPPSRIWLELYRPGPFEQQLRVRGQSGLQIDRGAPALCGRPARHPEEALRLVRIASSISIRRTSCSSLNRPQRWTRLRGSSQQTLLGWRAAGSLDTRGSPRQTRGRVQSYCAFPARARRTVNRRFLAACAALTGVAEGAVMPINRSTDVRRARNVARAPIAATGIRRRRC